TVGLLTRRTHLKTAVSWLLMSWLLQKKILTGGLVLLVLTVGGWLYANRTQKIDIATYVPESALGYLEINDWPRVLERLTATKAWRQLAPASGVTDKLNYAGRAGWLARFGAGGEAGLLARSQFALVVTGLEVRGEEIKPHLALIAETHSRPALLGQVAESRLPKFAEETFGQVAKESGEYSGVTVTSYRAAAADRGIFAAQIESELIVANQMDALAACIDARLGRAASMANNFYLRNSREVVERDGSAFGFVTSDGVTRLLRFGAYLISGGAFGKAALAGAVGDVFTEFSRRTADGIAYGASFENGEVVDRYALLFKPDLVDALKTAVKPSGLGGSKGEGARAFAVIPGLARNVTLISVENPMKTLDGLEAAIAGRVGVAQSFLLHQFLLGAREAFFGLQQGSKADEAIGDEIASFDLSSPARDETSPDRVWLVAVRDSALIMAIVERAMIASGAVLAREKHRGYEILSSSDPVRGSAAFIQDFVALGRRERLLQVIDLVASGQNLKTNPSFASAAKITQPVAVRSYDWATEESAEMMATIAGWTSEGVTAKTVAGGGKPLPLAVSATSVHERGVYVESHSPFGHFPFFVSLVRGSSGKKTGE
ncbi:MAG: hypothetical protein ACREEM_53770, partial [Blastocatellia bacterium]